MKNFKLFVGFALIALFSFEGCKKHSNTETDIRENLVGTYTGNKQSIVQWSTLSNSFSDSTRNDNIVFKVAIDSSASGGLVITESGPVGLPSLRYKASAVTTTGVGIVFSIPQQAVPISVNNTSVTVDIVGLKSYTLNNNKYDGGYVSATKQMIIGYTGTLQSTFQQITVNVPYSSVNTGTKP
jgi:hypothetical protein